MNEDHKDAVPADGLVRRLLKAYEKRLRRDRLFRHVNMTVWAILAATPNYILMDMYLRENLAAIPSMIMREERIDFMGFSGAAPTAIVALAAIFIIKLSPLGRWIRRRFIQNYVYTVFALSFLLAFSWNYHLESRLSSAGYVECLSPDTRSHFVTYALSHDVCVEHGFARPRAWMGTEGPAVGKPPSNATSGSEPAPR